MSIYSSFWYVQVHVNGCLLHHRHLLFILSTETQLIPIPSPTHHHEHPPCHEHTETTGRDRLKVFSLFL